MDVVVAVGVGELLRGGVGDFGQDERGERGGVAGCAAGVLGQEGGVVGYAGAVGGKRLAVGGFSSRASRRKVRGGRVELTRGGESAVLMRTPLWRIKVRVELS